MNTLYFLLTIVAATSLISGTIVMSYGASSIIPSPNEQMELGISSANVVCKSGLTLIIRAHSETPACVKSSSSEKLIQKGWAIKLSKLLEKNPNIASIGEVKTIQIMPLYKDEGILQTKPNIILNHNFVFEACAKSSIIRSPEILITSDSETKTVKLSNQINPKSCQLNSTIIKAADTNSIIAKFVKKIDLSLIVGQLELKVNELKEKLAAEKKSLTDMAKQNLKPSDYQKKISEKTDNIITLRQELNLARAELQKNQYSLMVGQKAPEPIKIPLQNKVVIPTGNSMKENTAHVNKIEIVKQYSDAGRLKTDALVSSYNFIFEACAGMEKIQFPEILVKSDSELKSVKLSESIDPKSCQTTSTVVKAADTSTIEGMMVAPGEIEDKIKTLDLRVESLKEQIAMDKKDLGDLVKQKPAPVDSTKKVSELTAKIVNQRDELNQAREELTNLKYMKIVQ